MKIEEWKEALKKCKTKETVQNQLALKLVYTKAPDQYKSLFSIYKSEKCKHCGNTETKRVSFRLEDDNHKMTEFETQTIFKILILHKIPYDYAGWHNSEHGKKFIEGLKII